MRGLDAHECYAVHKRVAAELWGPDYASYVRTMAHLGPCRRWAVTRNRFPYEGAPRPQLVVWSRDGALPTAEQAAALAGRASPGRYFVNAPQDRSVPEVAHAHLWGVGRAPR